MTIVLQFYPNGEFSQGVDTSSNRPPKHVCKTPQISQPLHTYTSADIDKVAIQNADIPWSTYSQSGSMFASSTGATYTLIETSDTKTSLQEVSASASGESICIDTSIGRLVHSGLLVPLVHQSVESCEKPESRKKLLGMSKRMSRNIRNAVYLLEKQPGGKDVLSFLTLTLPALSTEGLKACCENWDSMVKRFFDWLRLELKSKGILFQHVYCTEIQLKRLHERGEYAPHLHVVFRGRTGNKSAWAITPKKARTQWGRCIRAFVSEKFDTRALENLQRIRYSAARYLSKYLSKGRNSIPTGDEENSIQSLKTQWGGMARTLSKSIRQNTQRFTSKNASSGIAVRILDSMESMVEHGCVLYWKRGFISLGIHRVTGLEHGLHVGCGCLRTPTYEGGLIPIMEYISALEQ